jgi:hypothetical protein
VADLQQGRLPAAAAPGVAAKEITAPAPSLGAPNILPGAGTTMIPQPHGSSDHGDAFLHRGKALATPPAPLPGTGQYTSQSPASPLSPFAHASQLLAGLGQAHPSVTFPQFTGENPKLWKTLCEQYFSMFGMHS